MTFDQPHAAVPCAPRPRRARRGVPLLAILTLVASACSPWGEPEVVSEGMLWIETASPVDDAGFAARTSPNPWIELLRSYQVLDEVVVEEGLAGGGVATRDAARELSSRLRTETDRSGRFLRLSLTGSDPEKVRSVLDAVMERHVEVAATLKGARLEERLAILEAQLEEIERDLESAELELAEARAAPDAARLARRVRTLDDLQAELSLRTESVRLEVRSIIPDVRILERASVPADAGGPPLYTWLAAVLGLVAALLGGAFLASRSERRLGGTGRGWTGDVPSVLAILLGSALAAILTALTIGG